MIYSWDRIIYNAYEPPNRITFYAEDMGKYYQCFEMRGKLKFADGYSEVWIVQNKETNNFSWQNDDKTGISPTFDEAWKNMPALVSEPDHFEETGVFELNDERQWPDLFTQVGQLESQIFTWLD